MPHPRESSTAHSAPPSSPRCRQHWERAERRGRCWEHVKQPLPTVGTQEDGVGDDARVRTGIGCKPTLCATCAGVNPHLPPRVPRPRAPPLSCPALLFPSYPPLSHHRRTPPPHTHPAESSVPHGDAFAACAPRAALPSPSSLPPPSLSHAIPPVPRPCVPAAHRRTRAHRRVGTKLDGDAATHMPCACTLSPHAASHPIPISLPFPLVSSFPALIVTFTSPPTLLSSCPELALAPVRCARVWAHTDSLMRCLASAPRRAVSLFPPHLCSPLRTFTQLPAVAVYISADTRLTGHTNRVLYLAMSPDGETIVTGAGDEMLRFWNAFPKREGGERGAESCLDYGRLADWLVVLDLLFFFFGSTAKPAQTARAPPGVGAAGGKQGTQQGQGHGGAAANQPPGAQAQGGWAAGPGPGDTGIVFQFTTGPMPAGPAPNANDNLANNPGAPGANANANPAPGANVNAAAGLTIPLHHPLALKPTPHQLTSAARIPVWCVAVVIPPFFLSDSLSFSLAPLIERIADLRFRNSHTSNIHKQTVEGECTQPNIRT
ncbi:hypothetical protein B0H16DRAFT_1805319 [Mycena metata]|uniref:Uncharacterized protein n=1 Tax=Mycena metata TaxID=1033252 RepID=A0AAD7H953_9AGAR|nr:hypothetical protein B0H16DRAFT_1805319 [Mycena metata]